MGDRLLHGDIGGCSGFGFCWPFDPGLLGHRDPLLAAAAGKVPPMVCLLQLGFLANANISCLQPMAVCHTYSAHTQSAQSTPICWPEGKLMTPDFCFTLAVYRLHLRPLRSHVQSPGFILIQCTKSLPCWCLPLFQGSAKRSTFQGQDSGMEEDW